MTTPENTTRGEELEDELPSLPVDSNMLTSPDSSDLILWSDPSAESSGPPPRLLPRFYPSATNRRRSSAASSRRNSLSSSHSHHSHHSAKALRSAGQPTSVAQHLRRASIIETRRARLQDRAAHAEQVRLRAALAKATPRTSNIEEKALAAQQAREQYIAKVAATCAEEVNRAKKVVEEMKEKRAADERRIRSEIAEKHAEAERRRQEYLNTPRKARASKTGLLDAKPTRMNQQRVPSQEEIAVKIQRAWRRKRRVYRAEQFQELGLSIERISQADFVDATNILCRDDVIRCTKAALDMLQLDTGATDDLGLVRTFLSAYMVLGHPSDIFSTQGQQEHDLITTARATLLAFDEALTLQQQPTRTPLPLENLATLHQAYTTYITAFEAWKKRDASVLIGTMVDQFVALDVIWQAVQDDTRGEVADDYRDGIRENQIMLLAKIKKLAGAERASTLIKQAIRESRRTRARRLPAGDVRPRPLSAPGSGAEAGTTSESTPEVAIPDLSGQDTLASPIEETNLGSVFSVIPPNRVVVHELLMDPAFRIEVSPQSDVRSDLSRSVCENMRQGVSSGEGEIWTVAVAENVRTRLLKLLKPGNSMHTLLTEALDPDHIRIQCRQRIFSYEKFFAFMADILPRLCAPFRDTEVQALANVLKADDNGGNVDVMIEKLFGLLHMIDLMSLDYANYMIQQAAPTLIREGQGYEQRMFAADLQADPNGLQRTTRWWRNASIRAVTEPASPLRSLTPTSSSATATSVLHFITTYANALVAVALKPSPLLLTEIPETLHLDTARLARLRADTLRYIVTSAILLTAKNLLKRDVRAQWKIEAKRVLEVLSTPPGSTYENDLGDGELSTRILSTVESGKAMPPTSRSQLEAMIKRFLAAAHILSQPAASPAISSSSDPLLTLLHTRLRTHILARLSATLSTERVHLTTTASEALAGIGMAEFVPQVAGMVELLERIRDVDLGSHGSWLRGLMGEEVTDSAAT